MKAFNGKLFPASLLLLISVTGLLYCKPVPSAGPVKFGGDAQGTYYAITYYDEQNRNFQPAIDSLLRLFDQTASLWVKQSVISRINDNDSTVVINDDFREIFRVALEVNKMSGGAFDITVGPLVRSWGFGPEGPAGIDTSRIDSLLALVGSDKIRISGDKVVKASPEVMADFNAIAQGYAVDLLGKFLEQQGIKDYLIDIGGEVLAQGGKPGGELWKVGIEKPSEDKEAERELESVVEISNKAMATSGSYRKYYEKDGVRYSHTIDPRTGYPVKHSLLSASVVAANCCLADAWATAFMVMGADATKQFVSSNKFLDVFLIYSDPNGEVKTWHSEGFGRYLKKEN